MSAEASRGLLLITVLVQALVAQTPTDPGPEAQDFDPETALQSWIDRQKIDEDGAAKLARQLVDHEQGLRTLGAWLRRTRPEQARRLARLDELAIRSVFASFDVEAPKGFVYAGQYDRLRTLQPRLGPTLASYVVEPPDWLPGAQRLALIEVLRDLYVAPPEPEIVDAFERLADDERETNVLTESAAFAAFQWGRPAPAERRLERFRELAGEVRAADDLVHQRLLAKAYWRLRDYRRAADAWALYLERTVAAELRVRAIDQYDAACSFSLSGRLADALQQIRLATSQIVERTAGPGNPVTKRMLENDPDLRAVRRLPEYAKLVAKAFPEDDDKDGLERP